MVKDNSDSEKGNLLSPHRLLLSINSKVFLYAPSHRQDNSYHGLCYTSRGALAGTRNSSMGLGNYVILELLPKTNSIMNVTGG